jgi:hypothetical protein
VKERQHKEKVGEEKGRKGVKEMGQGSTNWDREQVGRANRLQGL